MGLRGSTSRSHTGANTHVSPTARASVPVICPHAYVAPRSFRYPSAAGGGSSVRPRTCWPGPRSKSEPSSSGRRAVSRSALVSAATAARVPPKRMKPPTPAGSACSILVRSDLNEPRRQPLHERGILRAPARDDDLGFVILAPPRDGATNRLGRERGRRRHRVVVRAARFAHAREQLVGVLDPEPLAARTLGRRLIEIRIRQQLVEELRHRAAAARALATRVERRAAAPT